jgi:hypothetical protein
MIAQAEQMKAQAAMIKAQNDTARVQGEVGHKTTLGNVEMANATTHRLKVGNEIKKTNTELHLKAIDTLGNHMDRQQNQQPPVVIQAHPVHGDVDEHDIQTTMAKHGLNRDQVMHGLNRQAHAVHQGAVVNGR